VKSILSTGLIALFVLAAIPAQAIEPFVLLDNFSGDRINEDIWNGSRRPESDVLDVARGVKSGKLRLLSRSYADAPLPGDSNQTSVRLFLNDSEPVSQMAARFRVDAADISGYADGAVASQIRGELSGYFFHRRRSTGPAGCYPQCARRHQRSAAIQLDRSPRGDASVHRRLSLH
jgi:hypothetical protein